MFLRGMLNFRVIQQAYSVCSLAAPEAVPMSIPLAEALKLREHKEQAEAVGEDVAVPSASAPPIIPHAAPSHPKPKASSSRMANGKDKSNGTSRKSTPGQFDAQQTPWGYDNGRGKSILDNRPWATSSFSSQSGADAGTGSSASQQAMPPPPAPTTNGQAHIVDDPMDGTGTPPAGNPYPPALNAPSTTTSEEKSPAPQ
jgi:hypothetical protein